MFGGADGFWCYNGSIFSKFNDGFTGYIFEDKKGNIYTSSETGRKGWSLSKYEQATLLSKNPNVNVIAQHTMIFGILEDRIGHIWYGELNGVHRYNGSTVTDFKN
jgi:ligand-binding sensor domain-containing protein